MELNQARPAISTAGRPAILGNRLPDKLLKFVSALIVCSTDHPQVGGLHHRYERLAA
jgi:hypothetical protein